MVWGSNWGLGRWAALVIVLSGILRFGLALWWPWTIDEGFTFKLFTCEGWKIAISTYPYPNNHPLFSLLTVAAHLLPLPSIVAIRLLSVVLSVAVSWLFYRIALRWFGDVRALICLAILISSYPFFTLGFMARGYMLTLFLFLLMFDRIVCLSTDPVLFTTKQAVHLAVMAALGYFTVPTFVYAHAALLAWLGWVVVSRSNKNGLQSLLLHLAATAAIALVLYSPMLHYTGLGEMLENLRPFARPIQHLSDWLGHWKEVAFFAFAWAWPLGIVLIFWGLRQMAPSVGVPFAMAITIPFLIPLAHGTLPYDRSWIHILPLAAFAVTSALPQYRTSNLRGAMAALLLLAAGTAQAILRPDHSFTAIKMQEAIEVNECKNIGTESDLWAEYAKFYAWLNASSAKITTLREGHPAAERNKFDCWIDVEGRLHK